ncbi:hypothetical protein [Streptomyces lasiicapitis]
MSHLLDTVDSASRRRDHPAVRPGDTDNADAYTQLTQPTIVGE